MPELPEVEAFKSYIESYGLHHPIVAVTVGIPKVLQHVSHLQLQQTLVNHHFANVTRYGKYLVITINNSSKKLVLHFGMTGCLECLPTADSKTPVKFSAISFVFNNQTTLYFKSIRTFEKVWLVEDITSITSIHELGPDAHKLSYADFVTILAKYNKRNIKALLLDQKSDFWPWK